MTFTYGLCAIGLFGSLGWCMWFMRLRNARFVALDDSDGIVVKEHWRVIEFLYANRLPSWIVNRRKYDSYKRAIIKEFYEDDKPTYVTDGRGNTAVKVKNENRFKAWLREQGLIE